MREGQRHALCSVCCSSRDCLPTHTNTTHDLRLPRRTSALEGGRQPRGRGGIPAGKPPDGTRYSRPPSHLIGPCRTTRSSGRPCFHQSVLLPRRKGPSSSGELRKQSTKGLWRKDLKKKVRSKGSTGCRGALRTQTCRTRSYPHAHTRTHTHARTHDTFNDHYYADQAIVFEYRLNAY